MVSSMEIVSRNSVSDDLTKYCNLAKKDDIIQICEWANGEGYDITLGDRMFYLTNGELNAINYLVNALTYE